MEREGFARRRERGEGAAGAERGAGEQSEAGRGDCARSATLRERASAKLGDKFDLRAFHEVILNGGALPLPVLEKRVMRWVDSISAAPARGK